MQANQSNYLDKLDQLNASKLRIEYQLQNDTHKGWGEEAIMWRQSLLDELVKIEKDILRIQDVMDREVETPAYVVEVNGVVKSIRIVPQDLVSPRDGMISQESPLAQALAHVNVGSEVEITTPGGLHRYRLLQA
jgi:transcription elongation GreA/GreB family factor